MCACTLTFRATLSKTRASGQRGFDVLSARDAGQLHLDDDEQLAFAVAQGRALVTHNRHDFE